MPPRPQPGMQTTATITAVYPKPVRWQRSPASQNNETPTTCSAVQHAPNNKSSADRHVRWLETSTKCSKYILCINYASQAEARQITVDTVSKLTAKRQRLPDRGRSPRAPPRVHFRPPPSRPAKDDRNQVPHAKKGNTSHSGRSKAQRETPDHHGSHFPGSGTNVGHYKLLSTQRPGSPKNTTQHHDVSVQSTLDRRPMYYSQKMDPSSPNANSIMWTHTSLEINIKFKIK